MRFPLRLGLTALLILLASAAFPQRAQACTPPPGGLPTFSVTDHVNASDVVVEGTVVSVGGSYFAQVATIQVTQYFKGSGRAAIVVDGYRSGAMCGTEVRPEMHGIFYIRTDEFGRYYAMQLSQFDAFAEASHENVAEAIAAAGRDPRPVSPTEAAFSLTQIVLMTPPAPIESINIHKQSAAPTATSPSPVMETTPTPLPLPASGNSNDFLIAVGVMITILFLALLVLILRVLSRGKK